jgi:hypothetical protein
MDQYKGWSFKRSKTQLTEDVYNLVKQGKPLGQAMKENISDQLQANPEFQKWVQQNN